MHVVATPLDFLRRAETIYSQRTAVIEGDRSFTYAEFADRCRRAGGALEALGIRPGDRVATLARNSVMMLEAHYAVPSIGAILVPINHRLNAGEIGTLLEHAGVRLLLFDDVFADVVEQLNVTAISAAQYDHVISSAPPTARPVEDEHELLSINYTSGTTGRPKGVMYDHRGAYLQALAMVAHSGLGVGSMFLWTLPMFHCNGWTYTWAVTASGGTHVCLDVIDPARIWSLVHELRITHLNAAPTVLISMTGHELAKPVTSPQPLRVATGGAPPSPTLLANLAELNIDVTHLYGLTETYGPAAVCDWHPEWSSLPRADQARLKARQGNANLLGGYARVVAPDGNDVPPDGATVGEILVRGNNVMRGYFRDPDATREVIRDGWFHTGDLAVMHPDGYLEVRDRSKDIIISGGENIASIEIEQALAAHPDVVDVAVVAMKHDHWGEVPAAFVVVRDGSSVAASALIEFSRGTVAGFKVPKKVVIVDELPKTATGKVQKFVLRSQL